MAQDLHEDPLGIGGFEFVEFTAPEPHRLAEVFEAMGFSAVARQRSKNVVRYKQGNINLLLNMDSSGQAEAFCHAHGPSINAMAFRARSAHKALQLALARGTKEVHGPIGPMELQIPAIEGIGGSYPVSGRSVWRGRDLRRGFRADSGMHRAGSLRKHGSHLHRPSDSQCSSRSNTGLRGFLRARVPGHPLFRHPGKVTGLFSKAMTSPNGKIRIPLNKRQDEHSQIDGFLRDYRGEGIQHIALGTDDIHATVDLMRAAA